MVFVSSGPGVGALREVTGVGTWLREEITAYDAPRSYRSTTFTHVVWGKLVDERILPDTQALAAALR